MPELQLTIEWPHHPMYSESLQGAARGRNANDEPNPPVARVLLQERW
jgi:hypothetical protein